MASKPDDGEPEAKKLRSSDSDLKVILGQATADEDGARSDEHDGNQSSVRWYHSVILASRSKYIDAMLAAPMKEGTEKTITFPDIEPAVWDKMMNFLENPSAIRRMSIDDVVEVLTYYDKYDFHEGRELCDDVMTDFFEQTQKDQNMGHPPDIDKVVDCAVMAHEANLEKAHRAAWEYLIDAITSTKVPYGRTMFTETHLNKLKPLLLGHGSEFSRLRRLRLSNERYMKEKIQEPGWAKEVVEFNSHLLMNATLQGFVHHIELSGTNCNADGNFVREFATCPWYDAENERKIQWNGSQHDVIIEKRKEGWAISRRTMPTLNEDGEQEEDFVVTPCWICPCSVNLPLPPETGWISVDPLARGNPKIQYILRARGTMEGKQYMPYNP